MELALLVYLGSAVGELGTLLSSLGLLFAVGVPLVLVSTVDSSDLSDPAPLFSWIKRSFITGVSLLFFAVLTPSKQDYYTILGAYAGQTVATHEKTTELMSKTLKLIEAELDEALAGKEE